MKGTEYIDMIIIIRTNLTVYMICDLFIKFSILFFILPIVPIDHDNYTINDYLIINDHDNLLINDL